MQAAKEDDKLFFPLLHPLAEMIKETAIPDDFTFPTIPDSTSLYQLHFPGFTTSSLWCIPSTVSDLSDTKQPPREGEFGFEQKIHQRRSFSCIERGKRAENLTGELEFQHAHLVNSSSNDEKAGIGIHRDEEKMDMLWEDFNDESILQPSWGKRGGERQKGQSMDSASQYESDMDASGSVDLCCVQALKMSKSGSMMHHRRRNLLIILKALKKLFLVHKNKALTAQKKASGVIH